MLTHSVAGGTTNSLKMFLCCIKIKKVLLKMKLKIKNLAFSENLDSYFVRIKKVVTQLFSYVWAKPIQRILWYLKDVWEVDYGRNKLLIN